ncbi:MAG: patatin family protein, partial [Acidobacteriota bacterium]
TREDYIGIVKRTIDHFVQGIESNVRTRVLANPLVNLRMLFSPTYSRTFRVGELFEKMLFAKVDDGEGNEPRWIDDLRIHPKGEPTDFNPKSGNWCRNAKVPMLVLNATTLNTGHSWQFTASWMGESPAGIDPDVDGNQRLRRMYYHSEAPPPYDKVRLGCAVGASACVPGLFEPIAFSGLYSDFTVRLVDGGVVDNQGIQSLLDQDCSVIVVSDASGQMTTQKEAKGGVLWPLLRMNSALMERVRQDQFQDLKARKESGLIKSLTVVHLKEGLDVEPVNWVDCEEPAEARTRIKEPTTAHGIRKDIQELLASIRTDLDSFSEVEAYALMTSGYRMTEYKAQGIPGTSTEEAPPAEWPFLAVEGPMKEIHANARAHKLLTRLLEVAGERGFKIWRLSVPLKVTACATGLLLCAAMAWAWLEYSSQLVLSLTVGHVGWIILSVLLLLALGQLVVSAFRYRQILSRFAIAAGLGLLGWLVAQLHLLTFDKWFLKRGRIKAIIGRDLNSDVQDSRLEH